MIVDCLTCDNRFDLGFANDEEMKCHRCGVAFASRWRFADTLEQEHKGYKLLDFCPKVTSGNAEMTDEQIKDFILKAMQEQLLLITEKENLLIVKNFSLNNKPVTKWVAVLGKEDLMIYKPRA